MGLHLWRVAAVHPPAPLTTTLSLPQGLMSALPGQEATLSSLPAQQSYLPGQQPLYQQVSAAGPARGGLCLPP